MILAETRATASSALPAVTWANCEPLDSRATMSATVTVRSASRPAYSRMRGSGGA
jgi:hypothetical protein